MSLAQRAQPAYVPNQPGNLRAWPGAVNTGNQENAVRGSQDFDPPYGQQQRGGTEIKSAGPLPAVGKKPPPVSAKPKVVPVDPIAMQALSAATAANAGWGNEEMDPGRRQLLEGELWRKRADEIKRLESRPYLSPEEQAKLKKLKVEAEFDVRAQQAINEEPTDSLVASLNQLIPIEHL